MNIRIFAIVVGLWTSAVIAQPLVDHVPEDAIVYIGWQGTDALGPAYEQSKLKTFIESSSIPRLFSESLPQFMQKLQEDDAEKVAGAQKLGDAMKLVVKHPVAVFVSGFKPDASDDAEGPMPKIGIVVSAGKDKDAIAAAFNEAVKTAEEGDADLQARVIVEGDVVALVYGFSETEKLPAAGAASFAKSNSMASLKKHAATDAAFSVAIDLEAILTRIDDNVKQEAAEADHASWVRARDASGLLGAKRFIVSGGFAGNEWASQSFLEAPAPRKGLLKLLEPQPIDPALMNRVPRDATSVAVGQFDFAGFIGVVRDIVTAANPEAGKMMGQGLGAVSMSLGRRVEGELLAPLGNQWALFTSPTTGGDGAVGMVAVNKLDDEKLAKAAWGDFYFAMSNMLPNLLRQQGVKLVPKADDKSITKSIVYSMEINDTGIAPAFVVHGGCLYIGVMPSTVIKAATAADDGQFTAQPQFAERVKAIGGPALTGFTYADLSETAVDTLKQIEEVWPTVVTQAQAEGVFLPQQLFPPGNQAAALLGPALAGSWMDDTGFHSRDRSPFPGSSIFGYKQADTMTTVGVSAVAVAILLPSLNKARETANRIKAQANLTQIGKGCMLHSNENRGEAPPDLGSLLQQDITLDVFTSPSSDTTIPADVRNGTPEVKAAWVNANSDFVYIKPAAKLSAVASDTAIGYEKLGIHGKDGTTVLFADGHAEFMKRAAAIEVIQKQTGAPPVEYKKVKKSATTRPAVPAPGM